MRFSSPHDCVEAMATDLFHVAAPLAWDKVELRVIRWDEETITAFLRSLAGVEIQYLSILDNTHDRVEELAHLTSTEDKGLFTKMSLDVFSDGRFEARYGYGPVSEEDEQREDALEPKYWP